MLPETAGEKQNRITCAVDKMVFMCVTALKISVSASDSSLSLHVINIVILRDASTCISDSREMRSFTLVSHLPSLRSET